MLATLFKADDNFFKMVAWSAIGFRNLLKNNASKVVLPALKQGFNNKAPNYIPVRYGGHGHEPTLWIRTSRYSWTKFKDVTNFYILVGIIPIGIIVLYCHIFIGPAKLIPTPEGYEPKHWEYYPHPITRFFAKYLRQNPQERYERNLHHVFIKQEISQLRVLENKIHERMRDKEDYQSWYFMKPQVKYGRKVYEINKEHEMTDAGRGPNYIQ